MTLGKQIWALLSPSFRRQAIIQLLLMIVGMLLEMIGIGLVLPALMAITGVMDPRLKASFARWLPSSIEGDPRWAVLYGLLVLLALYVVKAAFLAFAAWKQAGFVSGLQAEVSQRLFSTYLAQPWTFHLQRNSAQMIRNIFHEVTQFSLVVQYCLTSITEAFVLVGVASLLLYFEPTGCLVVVAILGAATWFFQWVFRDRVIRWGEARQKHDGCRVQHVQQGLGAAKDVILSAREAAFESAYRRHNEQGAKVNQRLGALQQLPRLWYELIAVVGLVILASVLLLRGNGAKQLVPTLGLFAASAFRLLPSANRMLSSLQGLRFALPSVKELSSELALECRPRLPRKATRGVVREAIAVNGVTFRYPESSSFAIEDVSFTCRTGTSTGIIGGSGAGKSTLVDGILGLLTPTRGAIFVDGHDIHDDIRWWQGQIGYVPQSIFLIDDTICRNIALGVPDDEIDNAAVQRALVAAQLHEFVATLPAGIETFVGERGVRLSGGQRQRIGIARALYLDPPVLVLDEATSSLDVETEAEVMAAVNRLHGQKTMIIVAHRLSTVSACDQLIRLDGGRVVGRGSPMEVMSQ